MTHEKTERKIREACPELMELSFGCSVAFEGSVGMPHIWHTAVVLQTMPSGKIEVYTSYPQYLDKEKLRVNGHKIRLEHVLRAINKKLSERVRTTRMAIDMGGQFFGDSIRWEQDQVYFYDLTTDWSGQSEETKRFVGELLGTDQKET